MSSLPALWRAGLVASSLATLPAIAPASAVAQVATSSAAAPDDGRGWRLRVPLDSGEVLVSVTSEAASIEVAAPTGTFVQTFRSPRPLADWADETMMLAPPSAPAAGGSTGRVRYSVIRLREPGDSASRRDDTEFQLTRLDASDAPSYLLSGTNGIWTFALHVRPEQAAALLAALLGQPAPGALPLDHAGVGHDGATRPLPNGAWLEMQTEEPVRPGPRPPRPEYPRGLASYRVRGTVLVSFIVDPDGSVRPSSIRLLGRADPHFAVAVRDALLRALFHPAKIGGKAVPALVQQSFDFSVM